MRRFLLATTATAVVLGAYGLADAQTGKSDRSGTQTQVAPSTQSQAPSSSGTPSGSTNHTMTTGQSNTSTGTSAGAQQTTPPAAGSGSSTNSSGGNASSQAQGNSTNQTPANQAQQSPSGAGTNSQQRPGASTNTAQQPTSNTNTAQQPSGNANPNTAQRPNENSNVNTAQQPAGNARTNTAQEPNGNTSAAQRPSSKEGTTAAERPSNTNTAQSGSAGANVAVNINERERTRLSQTFAKLDVRPINNVDFRVSVGTVVPRDIRLETVPSDVVEIVPQFRGYKFFAVRDEIVIVEPSSLKIVAVLPRSGGGSASVTTERKSKFSEGDRALMRKHVHVRAETRAPATTGSSSHTTVIVGERVPDTVEIRSFPEEVYRESPRLKEYRYIEEGDRAYVVEPGDRRVIEEIE